ncbi:hypothetical protein GQ54DRAFT_314352 [Martensiomyces pterosporus]|nr:hypothetical protein GQ54DRAFT_314352 [Martensiomyces pterosporus]
MALLDELPLEILLAVVKWLSIKYWDELEFCQLLPVASVNTSLRRSLLPLLYRDLVFKFIGYGDVTFHNAALANSAGCSEYVRRVSLFVITSTTLDNIVRVVRDVVDAGNETKWPNLRSYACIYDHEYLESDDWFSCSDFIRQLDNQLPKLRQASLVTCGVSSDVVTLAYTPPSLSFSTQLTSLCLDCKSQCIDANHLPLIFAPTLVDLALYGINPNNVWNIFYDGHENQTVVFARLKRLNVIFTSPLIWAWNHHPPPHLEDATRGILTKMSVWTAGATSGKPVCRVPLFPVLRTLKCEDMTYDFCDFISRTQCHNSLVSLRVRNYYVHFDFDAELFKSLETVEFDANVRGSEEEIAGPVGLYKSAFASLLRAKTNMQRMEFKSTVRDTLFQVPPDIGCTNLRSLFLEVEVDFKSMLRLLSNLKHLIQLELYINGASTYGSGGGRRDTTEYTVELQPLQADEAKRSGGIYSWLEKVELIQEIYNLDDVTTATAAATRLNCNMAAD